MSNRWKKLVLASFTADGEVAIVQFGDYPGDIVRFTAGGFAIGVDDLDEAVAQHGHRFRHL